MTEDSYFNTYNSGAFIYLLGMAPKHYCAKKAEPERSYEEKTQDCQRWKTSIGVNFTFDEIEKSWFFFLVPD